MGSLQKLFGIIILIGILFCFFWLIFPIWTIILEYPYISVNFYEPINVISLNKHFTQVYNDEIYSNGKQIISDELDKINNISDPRNKLNEIFVWEMNDWHNPLWEPQSFYSHNGDDTFRILKGTDNRFKVIPNAELRLLIYQRNPNGTLYAEDPYTLAFTKVGSCRELSNLFSYMAIKSGIKSRTVQTVWDHQWSEVEIDGEKWYYDPWCAIEHGYYNSTDGNLTFNDKWFNKIEYFRDNCHDKAYLNSYNEFPWGWATVDYTIAYISHDLNRR